MDGLLGVIGSGSLGVSQHNALSALEMGLWLKKS